jgi:hypothetical protein
MRPKSGRQGIKNYDSSLVYNMHIISRIRNYYGTFTGAQVALASSEILTDKQPLQKG